MLYPMPVNNQLIESLTKVATFFVTQLKAKIDEVKAPSGIKGGITIGAATPSERGAYIDVIIQHPAAGAFEYGSGLTSERYPPAKYKIEPVKSKWLAFPWGAARNIPGPIRGSSVKPIRFSKKTGKAVLPYVWHPGVKARPYIRPTIAAVSGDVIRILGETARVEFILRRPKVEVIKAG